MMASTSLVTASWRISGLIWFPGSCCFSNSYRVSHGLITPENAFNGDLATRVVDNSLIHVGNYCKGTLCFFVAMFKRFSNSNFLL